MPGRYVADKEAAGDADRRLAILAYHKIGKPSPDAWETWYYVPEAIFANQLDQLRDLGWQPLDASSALAGLRDPTALPRKAALITFDDGYRSVLECALPIMAELGFPGVIFVPTDYVGDVSRFDANSREPPERVCDWDELRALEQGGISVQSHGASHRTFSELSRPEIEQELVNSKALLQHELGRTVDLFAFPYGDPGADATAVEEDLRRSGYSAACLFLGGQVQLPPTSPYALTRIPMWPDTELEVELR